MIITLLWSFYCTFFWIEAFGTYSDENHYIYMVPSSILNELRPFGICNNNNCNPVVTFICKFHPKRSSRNCWPLCSTIGNPPFQSAFGSRTVTYQSEIRPLPISHMLYFPSRYMATANTTRRFSTGTALAGAATPRLWFSSRCWILVGPTQQYKIFLTSLTFTKEENSNLFIERWCMYMTRVGCFWFQHRLLQWYASMPGDLSLHSNISCTPRCG